jgi:FtsP/CotA-like multicopper oxidase with cupredoxin domain
MMRHSLFGALLLTGLAPFAALADEASPQWVDPPLFTPDLKAKLEALRVPTPGGPDRKSVRVVASGERDLELDLVVEYAKNKIGKDDVCLRSYNGLLVGPTIRARPGDTLNVHLYNKLPKEPADGANPATVNTPHGFNSTNLHTHGLHVSPTGNSDNVLLNIGPGQDFQYEIKIPADHPAGTFWYHAHKHGSVALQLASGMAGALIIEGDIDQVPEIRAARERLFVFQQIQYQQTSEQVQDKCPGMQGSVGVVEDYKYAGFGPKGWQDSGRHTTINGVVVPTLTMRPGEVQRWRFVHAGIRETIRLKVKRVSSEETLAQHVIAYDGITTGRLDQETELELQPGYRADVLLQAGVPGEYELVDEAAPADKSLRGNDEPRKLLAKILVAGPARPMKLPKAEVLSKLVPFKPITATTGKQEVVFNIDTGVAPAKFTVNGQAYNPTAKPRQLPLGGVEEWTVSATKIAGHPFHIHVNPFQLETAKGPIWKDTLFIPAGQTLKFRTRYERYIGTFVLHCHILDHEDQGMMETVEIVPPGGSSHDHSGHMPTAGDGPR